MQILSLFIEGLRKTKMHMQVGIHFFINILCNKIRWCRRKTPLKQYHDVFITGNGYFNSGVLYPVAVVFHDYLKKEVSC